MKTEKNLANLSHGRFPVVGDVVFGISWTTKGLVPARFKPRSVSREGLPRAAHGIAVPRLFEQFLSVSRCGRT